MSKGDTAPMGRLVGWHFEHANSGYITPSAKV